MAKSGQYYLWRHRLGLSSNSFLPSPIIAIWSPLRFLPLETLHQILDQLQHLHKPSLYAFSLTSKACQHATIPFIFHHVHFKISTREALLQDVDALLRILSNTEAACHIRCLSIKGALGLPWPSKVEGYKSGTQDRHTVFRSYGMDQILDDEEACWSTPYVVYDESVIQQSSDEDIEWAPIVEFIKTLPFLDKLFYDCKNQFPPSLLDALHTQHPQCKLYHLTFRFRTLLWGTPYPYEMALATSPCLYSIKVECSRRDSEGEDDFNYEAVMELAAGLAPNLREARIVHVAAENSSRYDGRPRGKWQGLPGFVPGKLMGSLTTLSIIGLTKWSPDLLRNWSKHTDFHSLRHLTLRAGYGSLSMGMNSDMMEWFADNYSFPRLKTLDLCLRRDYDIERPQYFSRAATLLGSFNPLEELSLHGQMDSETLNAILLQHGQTLKKLVLRPSEARRYENRRPRNKDRMTIVKKHIEQIQANCPQLANLAISIKRTQSDATETNLYKSFGKMKRLQSLFLTLDCSDWLVIRDPAARNETLFDEVDKEVSNSCSVVKKGHIREALMNCAVDDRLSRSIWNTVSQNKMGRPLKTLKLWPCGGGEWGDYRHVQGLSDICKSLGRSWLIEQVCRDDEGILHVRELAQKAREAHDRQLRPLEEDSELMQVFRRIWPNKIGKDWREDWSSIPLQV